MKKINELSKFLNENFPDSLDDMKSSLHLLQDQLEEIDKKNKLIEEKRPLSKNTLKSIREKLFLEWTYNSNAIEGNTLTLSETKVVLEDGITIGGKTLKEHLEVVNHKEAIYYMEDIISNNKDLSERQAVDHYSMS